MINKIITLENKEKYLILLNEIIDNKCFYIGIKIKEDKFINEFKLFLEKRKDKDLYFELIDDEELIKVLVNKYVLDRI